jgi:hypothetical protein
MATTRRASNLKKPWAWLAALAALGLVLASSTALYVVNPSVKLTLPWWTAIAAPAAIYALILPLCVPGLRAGGWLAGFGILSLLHVALGATTAWLYSVVTFLPVRQFVASAFWSFPPALVLDMVGALVMTLPFLDALAPRPADRATAKKSARPAAPKPAAADAKGRENWVRGSGSAEAGTGERTLVMGGTPLSASAAGAGFGLATGRVTTGVVTTAGAATTEAPRPPVAEPERAPDIQDIPAWQDVPAEPELPPAPPTVGEDPLVPAATLSSTNGVQSEVLEDMPTASEAREAPAAALPDFRQALKELFGDLATKEIPPAEVTESEELPAAVAPSEPPAAPVTAAPAPTDAGSMIRIPFERVSGQLPPGAFRLPLHQVGAQLVEREMLLVPPSLIVPQLGEGVVQVEWDVVAGQFPPEVFAVPLSEVAARIVNGRLLLPLDEIVRQLSRDVFTASMARGPMAMPGFEEFPAPFRPPGWEEGRAVEIIPAAGPLAMPADAAETETLAIEVPDADLVAHDLGLASLPPVVPVVEPVRIPPIELVPPERVEDDAAEPASELAAAEDLAVGAESALENIVEIDEVPTVIDVDSLLDDLHATTANPVAPSDVEVPPVVPSDIAPPDVVESSPAAVTVPTEPVIRIPFERVMSQLPPGVFRVPLAQVAARLAAGHVLLVPQSLVVSQLAEGAVHVTWETVASQFPAEVLAVPAAEVSQRIVNGSLVLPLDEIMGQLPPDIFAAFMTRGPVEVPGIEGFPAPFKPIGHEEPAATLTASPPAPVVEAPASMAPPVTVAAATPAVIQDAPPARQEARPASDLTPAMPAALPATSAVTPAAGVTRSDVSRLASLLSQDALVVGEAQIAGFTVITVGMAGLAGASLASAAGSLSARLAGEGPWPVEQATFRAVGGALVLTPVGAGWATGAVIAVGLRASGSLARLEMLARRAAAGYAVAAPAHRPPDGARLPQLEPMPEPTSSSEVAGALDAFGKLTPTTFRDIERGVLVHCFLPAGAAAASLAAFGYGLVSAMSAESPAGGFGSFHSAVLRSGTKRLEVRRLPSAAGPAAILIVGGADTGRPGLARLQVERAAARLLGA